MQRGMCVGQRSAPSHLFPRPPFVRGMLGKEPSVPHRLVVRRVFYFFFFTAQIKTMSEQKIFLAIAILAIFVALSHFAKSKNSINLDSPPPNYGAGGDR